MLDNEELAIRIAAALDAAQRRLKGVSLAEIAANNFGVTAQALTGWKTTGRVHRKHFAELSRISGFPMEFFLSEAAPRVVREPHASYTNETKVHPILLQINTLIQQGLITPPQIDRILQNAKECAEITAARRSLALGKSAGHNRKSG